MTLPTTPFRGRTTARTSASMARSITRTPMASSSTCRMTRRSPGRGRAGRCTSAMPCPTASAAPCSAATSCSIRHRGGGWRELARRSRRTTAAGCLTAGTPGSAPPTCARGPTAPSILCDFHDQRTAHPDPEANWDRSNGRIYRVAPPGTAPVRGLDLGRKTSRELVELLRHPNGWYAEQARVQLAARRDRSTWPALIALARQTENARLALQGLWGLYVSGGFNDTVAADLLRHPGEYVRAWTVRLLGDDGKISTTLASRLAEMAAADPSVTVRCQLAASARRLPGADGLPIVERLLRRGLDRDDPYMPLMLWWAVEARALTDTDRLLRFFGSREAWEDARSARELPAARPAIRRGRDSRGVRCLRAAAVNRDRRDTRTTPWPPSTWAWPSGPSHRAAWAWPGSSTRSRSRSEEPRPPSATSSHSRSHCSMPFQPPGSPPRPTRYGCASPSAPAWPMRRPPCSRRLPPRRPLHRGGACCSAFSLSWDRREASLSPSPSLRATSRLRCSPRRSTCWPATATTKQGRGSSVSTRRLRSVSEGGCATSCSPGRRSARAFLERVDNKADRRGGGADRSVAAGRPPRRSQARRPGAQALGQHSARHR